MPKNKKGLETLRELVSSRVYKKLKRKFRNTVSWYCKNLFVQNSVDASKPKVIWFCWLQGIKNAPELVKRCYKSVQEFCHDYKIIEITSENYADFTDIPEFIIKKWKTGIITNTHFSDILRTNLLVKNGGIWIDATVFLTSKIPVDIENAPLFLFRTYKPGSNGKTINLSSWFLSSCKDNKVLALVQELLFEYWKKKNYLCDYFLFHDFVQIALDTFQNDSFAIPKYTNETPHFMLFELAKPFDQTQWNSITTQSFCHKLTYKLSDEDKNASGTFYKRIVEEK
ncbi:capsular polysaccharide synthesis protein [Treponema sp.]|uniref:capsular polysaccharide synthesis protein n=1 Tax=Treponema sp. TaxID=166 RepID=UPI003F0965EF